LVDGTATIADGPQAKRASDHRMVWTRLR
jgi:hypothetical protein